ncbi:uncharacterized protein LOC116031968 [Ipomoea triloba]|uniref:uncharacterized protein LOC116031968 n=1 Tax=Ipomoea triloba TaxID=35885 RepID=UPI00125D7EC5|nr:uncharacterized protein LOC116031968 [Ipomoea triloba]
MGFESIPGKGVSTGITASSSASEVVDFLRTSFQRMDFSLGQKILTDRENALKAEIESLKKANESAQKVLEFENCKMGVELQRLKKENIDLGENNARLKREIEELKAEKKEVEERLEASEERYAWLDKRVSRMEEDLAFVATKVPNVSNIADKLDDELSFGTQNHLGPSATKVGGSSSSPTNEVPYVVLLSDDEDENHEMPLDDAEILGKSGMGLGPKMNELKGESLQRKRIFGNDDDGDSSSFCVQKRKLLHETEVTPVFDSPKNHGDARMSGYESIARVKCEAIVSPMAGKSTASSHLNLKPQKVGSGPWLDQNEMRLAFDDDCELCMSAVCALYRKLISAPLSMKPMDRGFDSNDELGVELAKYLIDDHPENKLNRAMSEISKVAIEQSKRLALKYSGQLFRIYSSGEDPLFCHNCTSFRR